MSVVVLCNSFPAPVQDIKAAVLDIILGYEPDIGLPPASITVCLEMEINGLDSAVALWNSLKANHPEEYDFSQQHFTGLFIAMYMDRVEDAKTFTRLYVSLFPGSDTTFIKGYIENFWSKNPTNKAAPAILEIIASN